MSHDRRHMAGPRSSTAEGGNAVLIRALGEQLLEVAPGTAPSAPALGSGTVPIFPVSGHWVVLPGRGSTAASERTETTNSSSPRSPGGHSSGDGLHLHSPRRHGRVRGVFHGASSMPVATPIERRRTTPHEGLSRGNGTVLDRVAQVARARARARAEERSREDGIRPHRPPSRQRNPFPTGLADLRLRNRGLFLASRQEESRGGPVRVMSRENAAGNDEFTIDSFEDEDRKGIVSAASSSLGYLAGETTHDQDFLRGRATHEKDFLRGRATHDKDFLRGRATHEKDDEKDDEDDFLRGRATHEKEDEEGEEDTSPMALQWERIETRGRVHTASTPQSSSVSEAELLDEVPLPAMERPQSRSRYRDRRGGHHHQVQSAIANALASNGSTSSNESKRGESRDDDGFERMPVTYDVPISVTDSRKRVRSALFRRPPPTRPQTRRPAQSARRRPPSFVPNRPLPLPRPRPDTSAPRNPSSSSSSSPSSSSHINEHKSENNHKKAPSAKQETFDRPSTIHEEQTRRTEPNTHSTLQNDDQDLQNMEQALEDDDVPNRNEDDDWMSPRPPGSTLDDDFLALFAAPDEPEVDDLEDDDFSSDDE